MMLKIDNLPEGWKLLKLDEVLNSIENGNRPKGGIKDIEEGIPSIGGEHLNSFGGFKLDNLKLVSNDFYNSLKRGKIKKGDVLVVKDGATTGKTSFVNDDFPYEEAAVNEHVFILRGNNKLIDQKFLFYHLFSPLGQIQIAANFRGATIGGINTKFVKNYRIVLPPLETQKKIVEILERAEKLKEWRTEADELTDEFLKSIFLDMFGDPGKNDKKWEIVKLKEISEIDKKSIKPAEINAEDKYIGLEHIESNTGEILNILNAKETGLKSNKYSFDEECVLYGKLRPYLNKVALPDFKGLCSTDILPIRPIKGKSVREFIAFLLRNNFYVKKATEESTGANLPRISPKALENFEIYHPPLQRQKKFAEIVNVLDIIKDNQKQSKKQINDLFNALMQKAFKGELVC